MDTATQIKKNYSDAYYADVLYALAEANKLAVEVDHDANNTLSIFTFSDDSKLTFKAVNHFKFEVY